MKSYCTRGTLPLMVALLLLGAAACTQQKPAVPTPTLIPLEQTPLLPSSVTETPGAVSTAPSAVETTVETAAPTSAVGTAAAPTILPTPTTGAPAQATEVAPVATAVSTPAPQPTSPSTGGCPNPYTVQAGEWLYQIARKCGVSASAIINANPGVNLNVVYPGEKINMPGGSSGGGPGPSGRTYVVQYGDTLYRIAVRFGVTVSALMQANGLTSDYIYPGEVLKIP